MCSKQHGVAGGFAPPTSPLNKLGSGLIAFAQSRFEFDAEDFSSVSSRTMLCSSPLQSCMNREVNMKALVFALIAFLSTTAANAQGQSDFQ